ncbi:glycoside hydrolase, partial [Escherichia coli]|nr:glycoside hydrolase [Escherichia coli]
MLRVEKEWGNIHVDYINVEPATPPPAGTLTASLVDKQASKEAKAVWAFMIEMYGKKVLSGQYGEDAEMNYIRAHTGKLPAVRGFDLLSYSAAVAWNDGSTQRIIDWYTLKKGIPTVCWHWFSPAGATGDKSFYTADTDFDLTTA